MRDLTIFTIADAAFQPGLAGLINSLRSAGFEGEIGVGSPHALPCLAGVPGVRAVELSGGVLWFGFRKAGLLAHEARGRFLYLDADIVVPSGDGLRRIAELSDLGPVLALEGLVGPSDHRRLRWARRLGGARPHSDAWAYYNGGFLSGALPRDRALVGAWHEAMEGALANVPGYQQDPDFPFGDQDVLNAVVQARRDPVTSIQFPDWWSAASPLNPFVHVGGFARPAFYHSTGDKPWNLRRVPPRAPNAYEALWFRHAVLDPVPVRAQVSLPASVQRWLHGSLPGQLESRGRRLAQKVRGR